MHTFETPSPVHLKVQLSQGLINVIGRDTTTTTVELEALHGDSAAQELIDNARVEQRGDNIVVEVPKAKGGLFRSRGEIRATITVPTGSHAKLETSSADIKTDGELGDLNVASGSGDVELDVVASAKVRTGSGDIAANTVHGSCDIKCGSADVAIGMIGGSSDVIAGSGDVTLGQLGGVLKIKTGSGDIVVKQAGDGIDALAGSGDVLVRRVEHGRLKAKTGSGDITIGVADGTAAYLDISTVTGDVTSSLDASEAPSEDDRTVELIIQSGTGDVVLQRA
jgi:DUF4097 and DUF4098 domain-containing protein YvlB